MPEDKTEIVRAAIAAFNAGEADALIALCHPDVEFVPLVGEMEGPGYRGLDGVRRWMQDMNDVFDEYRVEYGEIEDLGDVVLVTGRTSGRGRASGAEVERSWNLGVRFREGRLVHWAFGDTREEVLEVAGPNA